MRSPLYLQLWSLRHSTSTGPEAVLRQVPSLGFDGVELAGDYGWDGEKWKALLNEIGLTVIGAHVGLDALENDFQAKLAFHRAIGAQRLVIPSLNRELQNSEGYRAVARRLNALGAMMDAEGFQLGYHNHAFEFDRLPGSNEVGMEILLRETDPALVHFEFDAFWIETAGLDAVEYFRRYSGRVFLMHAKDLRKRDREEVPTGQGDVDFRTLIPMCTANDWQVIVEYEGANAAESVKQGAAFLRPLWG